MTDEPVVLFSCGPFCFGSSTMAISLAERLAGCRKIALCRGVSQEICQRAGVFDECVAVDDDTAPAVLEALRRRHDLRLYCDCNVFDPPSVRFCRETGLPMVWIQMHLWRKGPEFLANVDAAGVTRSYLASYPGFEEDFSELGAELGGSSRFALCPPVIGEPPRLGGGAREPRAVVGLGGLQSPLYDAGSNPFPRIVLRLLTEHLASELEGLEILVCASESAIGLLRRQAPSHPSLRFAALPRPQYLDTLARSSLLFTIPSIHSPLEGFQAEVPVVFLPSQNFTQFFHRRQWRSWGFAEECPGLEELYPGLDLDRCGDEELGTVEVLAALARLEADPPMLRRVAETYASLLQQLRSPSFRSRKLERQQQALTRLFPIGLESVTRELRALAGLGSGQAVQPF